MSGVFRVTSPAHSPRREPKQRRDSSFGKRAPDASGHYSQQQAQQQSGIRSEDNGVSHQTQPTPWKNGEIVCAACYSTLDNLAHRPRGTPAQHSLSVYGLCQETGRLTLLAVSNDTRNLHNAAFIRSHPKKDVFYVVTESIQEEGWCIAFGVCPMSGQLRELCREPTQGRSACYISLSHDLQYLLIVNYWDSSMVSIPIDENGLFVHSKVQKSVIPGPKADFKRQAHGDDPHSKHRLNESHAHAVVFDPSFGRMVYVPDLGEGVIKQFLFNELNGSIIPRGVIKCGSTGDAGPRYLEFHPSLNVCYCVNELSSTVIVYRFDEFKVLEQFGNGLDWRRENENANEKKEDGNGNFAKAPGTEFQHDPTLDQIQEVPTVPPAFPRQLNTCGRICVDPTGRWVLVSNRGHDSIAVYSINHGDGMMSGQVGLLKPNGYYHTAGYTPRHFKFSWSGKWLFAANQDSDNIGVFKFNQQTGELAFVHRYPCMSPNFIETKVPCPSRHPTRPWVYSRM